MKNKNKNSSVKEWATSDLHLFHKNIIDMGRPQFKDMNEMIETIVKNNNKLVAKDDVVYNIGDFSFGSKEKTKEVLSRMNGKHILVIGNHDHHSNSWYYDVGFSAVVKTLDINKFGYKIRMSHKPRKIASDYLNVHGHLHAGESQEVMSKSFQHVNVCCELFDYKPVLLKEVIESKGNEKPKWFKLEIAKLKYRFKLKAILKDRYAEKKFDKAVAKKLKVDDSEFIDINDVKGL